MPSPLRDPANVKFDSIVAAARGGLHTDSRAAVGKDTACDLVVLLETRTSHATSRLQHLLPDYKFFTYPPRTEGLKGQGVAILVHERISDFVSLWGLSEDLQAIWLKVQGHVFGVQGHVLFGGCYIPPQSQSHTAAELEDWYTILNTDIHRGMLECTQACIVGDFNAHLGTTSEFTHEHFDLQDRFPELGRDRMETGSRRATNLSGKLLMDVAATVPLVLSTGRGRGGDVAQVTCRDATRTEHAMLSPDLFDMLSSERGGLVQAMTGIVGSDHCPLKLTLSTPNGPIPGVHEEDDHTCNMACAQSSMACWSMSWKDDPIAQARFAALLAADVAGREQFDAALAEGNVNAANVILMGMVHSAAHDSGLVVRWRCPLRRRGIRHSPAQQRAWFNAQCREARANYMQALWSGVAGHAREHLKKELRRLVRRTRRRYVKQRACLLLSLLEQRDPEAFDMVKRSERKPSRPTPIAIQRWWEYIAHHFGHSTQRTQVQVAQPAPAAPPPPRRVGTMIVHERDAARDQAVALGRGRTAQRTAGEFGRRREPPPPPRQGAPSPPRQGPPPSHVAPELGRVSELVGKALSRLNPSSAAGLDQLPAAFIKFARVRVASNSRVTRNVLAPMLSSMFHVCINRGVLPEAWKVARLSPLYKKGAVLQPNSYRMLAVSSVLYRLYANVVRALATEWAVREKKVPETQFGFYPGRDTMQPCFILRHLCHAAQWAKLVHSEAPRREELPTQYKTSRVYAAFMDFTQAYDKVNRAQLWQHLSSIGMPAYMLSAVKGMYEGDSYILVDGSRRTAPVLPTLGVKQGCPLSPLLFSLFINDYDERTRCGQHGIKLLGPSNRVVSHMFYADDLVLLSCSPSSLQLMLDALERYSRTKGLTVNAEKSKVVVFNTRGAEAAPRVAGQQAVFRYAGQHLEVVKEFKYLGLVFNRVVSMTGMQAPWSRALMGSIWRVRGIASEFGVKKSVWAMLRLFQTYALPSGMYGCQVWGSRYVHLSRVFDSDIARRHMCFLRRTAGVAQGTPHWALLAELNCKPYHFYWVRALLKFHQGLINSNSPLLLDVMKADAWLASTHNVIAGVERRCEACWSAELARGLSSIAQGAGVAHLGQSWAAAVRSGAQLDSTAVMNAVLDAYDDLAWKGCDDLQDIRVNCLVDEEGQPVGRKHATYFTWFKPQQPGLPRYIKASIDRHREVKQMLRFRLGSHNLQSNRGRQCNPPVSWVDRTCARCNAEYLSRLSCAVDDEYHVIFECEIFASLRDIPRVRNLISRCDGDVQTLMNSRQTFTVMKFVCDIMDTVDSWHLGDQT